MIGDPAILSTKPRGMYNGRHQTHKKVEMETKPLSVKNNVNPVTLYFEDLQFLMSLFGSTAKETTLRISDDQNEYEFSSVEELDKLKSLHADKFNYLSIIGHQPYLTLNLWPHGGELHISQDTPILRGLMEKAKDRLNLRRKKLYWIYSLPLPITFPIYPLFWGVWKLGDKSFVIGTIIILLSVAWFSLNWYSRFYNYSVIFSKTEKEHPSFFQRKKDEIILVALGAVIGAVITKLISE
jgi:hypothetical protein